MKIAVVTGASSGMGREFVLSIDKKYYKVLDEIWVLARRKERLEELQHKVKTKLRIFTVDLLQQESYNQYTESLEKYNPVVGILVNSSGFGKIGNFSQISRESNLSMIELNCQALTKVTYDTLPFMKKGGRIINLASSAAFLPQPGFAVYAASKSYVLSFSKALKYELAHRGIYVTAVCPGPVKTEFFDIAEEKSQIALYKKLVMANPVKVVEKAMRDAKYGKTISVYGLLMQAFEILCKVVPHELILKLLQITPSDEEQKNETEGRIPCKK